ncbi:ATP-binding protein [Kaistia dalseonensis]|nr:ATP-binding protein [Kaistia dalseonensis]
MSGRNHAYLDLAALPPVGAALLSERPTLLWAADGRRLLWANAAGMRFFGAADMATLLDRHFSATLPSTDQIARLARQAPVDVARMERISFATGGRLLNLAASCMRLILPDGVAAVLMTLDGERGRVQALGERAESLVEAIAAEDCLIAVLDDDGEVIAASGGFGVLSAGEAAIAELAAAMEQGGGPLVKRAFRIDDSRRAAGLARFEAPEGIFHLLVVGPAERIVVEPVSARPEPMAEAEPVASPDETQVQASEGAENETEGDEQSAPASPEIVAPSLPVDLLAAAEEPVPSADIDVPASIEQSATAEPPSAVPAETTDREAAFQFEQPAGPVRFVFQMDQDGRFILVSPEFAAVVGPRSGAIVGMSWSNVAAARGLDRAGEIAALIARRQPWSGVTLDWSVDGSGVRVAVDLAALPAFARDRQFEGYRGFGVIRPIEHRAPAEAVVETPVPAIAPPAIDEPVEAPSAPPSNVVRLSRASTVETERLSPPEQDAFRRIAAALGAPVAAATPKAEPEQPEPVALPVPTPPEAEVVAAVPEAPAEVTIDAALVEPVVASVPEPSAAPASDAALAVIAAIEAQLALSEQKIVELELILDTATDGVVVIDREGRIERINHSAEALFGIDAARVAGLPFTDLLAEESWKSALDYLDGLASNGVASVLNDGREVIGRVPQGGLIPLFMTMGRLGDTGKFCAVLRDITQWKNAEEELITARRTAETASMQKSDFLAKISHEIRTPLNAIIGFSEVMMEERFGPIGTERYKEYLRDIHVSGAHLMSLLNDLLDLSKIEAGKLDLSFEAVSLNEIVMECVALMQPQANRERIIIRTSLSSQVPSIVADPRSIRQIVLNLVSNAIKFTLAGGQVIVSTAMEEQGEVALRIRDTGVGMSEKDIETALKPFRQLATSSKPRSDGTGLGLPLTKALVEANRAAFAIDSAVGQGTLIRITFPTNRVLAS